MPDIHHPDLNHPDIVNLRSRISDAEWEARLDLAACYRLIARFGWADLVGTHTSLAVPGSNNNHFLINPHGLLFEQVTASSLVKIDGEGRAVLPSPYPVNKAGFVIHSAVHKARPDAACVMHTHTVAGMAVSMQEQGLLFASQHACFFYDNLAYHNIEHMRDGVDGRAALADDLGGNWAMIMRNHGLLACGRTVGETFWIMHTLERACAAQIAATAGGAALHKVEPDMIAYMGTAIQRGHSMNRSERVWPSLRRLLDDTDPSYRS